MLDDHVMLDNVYLPVYSVINEKYNKSNKNNEKDNINGYSQNNASNSLSCSGSLHRGSGLGTSASQCCYDATSDVHQSCTNNYCIGCCRTFRCDVVCGIGDYFCSCGVSGQACSSDDNGGGGGPCIGDGPCEPILEHY